MPVIRAVFAMRSLTPCGPRLHAAKQGYFRPLELLDQKLPHLPTEVISNRPKHFIVCQTAQQTPEITPPAIPWEESLSLKPNWRFCSRSFERFGKSAAPASSRDPWHQSPPNERAQKPKP